eukprot:g1967.t1
MDERAEKKSATENSHSCTRLKLNSNDRRRDDRSSSDPRSPNRSHSSRKKADNKAHAKRSTRLSSTAPAGTLSPGSYSKAITKNMKSILKGFFGKKVIARLAPPAFASINELPLPLREWFQKHRINQQAFELIIHEDEDSSHNVSCFGAQSNDVVCESLDFHFPEWSFPEMSNFFLNNDGTVSAMVEILDDFSKYEYSCTGSGTNMNSQNDGSSSHNDCTKLNCSSATLSTSPTSITQLFQSANDGRSASLHLSGTTDDTGSLVDASSARTRSNSPSQFHCDALQFDLLDLRSSREYKAWGLGSPPKKQKTHKLH